MQHPDSGRTLRRFQSHDLCGAVVAWSQDGRYLATTADDASRYRKNEEVEQARHQEPLIRLRRYLTELGVWDETREEELLADCQKQVDEAVETYLNTPVQAAGAMFDFMFEELPPALAEQPRVDTTGVHRVRRHPAPLEPPRELPGQHTAVLPGCNL